eukprot:gene10998-1998_t
MPNASAQPAANMANPNSCPATSLVTWGRDNRPPLAPSAATHPTTWDRPLPPDETPSPAAKPRSGLAGQNVSDSATLYLTWLVYLHLDKLPGTISDSLCLFARLEFYHSHLNGTIPECALCVLDGRHASPAYHLLKWLHLGGNNVHANISQSLSLRRRLVAWDLFCNQITTTICIFQNGMLILRLLSPGHILTPPPWQFAIELHGLDTCVWFVNTPIFHEHQIARLSYGDEYMMQTCPSILHHVEINVTRPNGTRLGPYCDLATPAKLSILALPASPASTVT